MSDAHFNFDSDILALSPGRLPIGPLKIDWKHPLARGLVSGLVPASSFGMREIVTRKETVYDTSITFGPYGVENLNANKSVDFPSEVALGSNVSVVCDITMYSNPSPPHLGIFGAASTSNDGFELMVNNTTADIWWAVETNWAINSTGVTFPSGEQHVMALTYSSGGGTSIFKDGVNIGGDAASGGLTYTSDFQLFNRGDDNTNFDSTGLYKWVWVWNRKISSGEVRSVQRDPYQFLIAA